MALKKSCAAEQQKTAAAGRKQKPGWKS